MSDPRVNVDFGLSCAAGMTLAKLIEAVRLMGERHPLMLIVASSQLAELDDCDLALEYREPRYRDGRLVEFMGMEVRQNHMLMMLGEHRVCQLVAPDRMVEIMCLEGAGADV